MPGSGVVGVGGAVRRRRRGRDVGMFPLCRACTPSGHRSRWPRSRWTNPRVGRGPVLVARDDGADDGLSPELVLRPAAPGRRSCGRRWCRWTRSRPVRASSSGLAVVGRNELAAAVGGDAGRTASCILSRHGHDDYGTSIVFRSPAGPWPEIDSRRCTSRLRRSPGRR